MKFHLQIQRYITPYSQYKSGTISQYHVLLYKRINKRNPKIDSGKEANRPEVHFQACDHFLEISLPHSQICHCYLYVLGKWVSKQSNSQSVQRIITGIDPVINLNHVLSSLSLLGTAAEMWLPSVALYLTLHYIDCVTSARQLHFNVTVIAVTLSVRVEGVKTQLLLCPQQIYSCN